MKKLIIGTFLMMACFAGKAQNETTECYYPIGITPKFKGRMKALQLFLNRNLKYPNEVGCVSGKVYIQFIVEKNGKITHPTIIKSLSNQCDAEAMRVVKLMPRWIPARDFNGKNAIASRFTIPVKFEFDE